MVLSDGQPASAEHAPGAIEPRPDAVHRNVSHLFDASRDAGLIHRCRGVHWLPAFRRYRPLGGQRVRSPVSGGTTAIPSISTSTPSNARSTPPTTLAVGAGSLKTSARAVRVAS